MGFTRQRKLIEMCYIVSNGSAITSCEAMICLATRSDKINSTARAARVEVNLPGTSAACAFLIAMHNKKMFYFENEGQGHGVQYSHWSHSMANTTSIEAVLKHFSLAITVFSRYLHCEIGDHKNVGQDHDVPDSQLGHSMANT